MNKSTKNLRANQIEKSKLYFTKAQANKNSQGKSAYLNYGDQGSRSKIVVQLPDNMCTPFGVTLANGYIIDKALKELNQQKQDKLITEEKYNEEVEKQMKDRKFCINIAVDRTTEDGKKVYDMMEKIDDALYDHAVKQKWFRKDKVSIENSTLMMHKRSIKYSMKTITDKDGNEDKIVNEDYLPTIKLGLQKNYNKEGYFAFKLIDSENNKCEPTYDNINELIPPGSKLKLVIQCSGVWIIQSTGFGLRWQAELVKVTEKGSNSNDFDFDDEEKPKEENPKEEIEVTLDETSDNENDNDSNTNDTNTNENDSNDNDTNDNDNDNENENDNENDNDNESNNSGSEDGSESGSESEKEPTPKPSPKPSPKKTRSKTKTEKTTKTSKSTNERRKRAEKALE